MEQAIVNVTGVVIAALVFGRLATRLGFPAVLGELLGGALLGPGALALLQADPVVGALADVGALLLMLYVGMEVDPSSLRRASKSGLLTALGGFFVPFAGAYVLAGWLGWTGYEPLLAGVGAGVTALATNSRILADLRLLDTRLAFVMLAGALIADVMALIAFAGVFAVARDGGLSMATVATLLGSLVAYFAIAAVVGQRLVPRLLAWPVPDGAGSTTPVFAMVVAIALVFAAAAHAAGLHAIVGAFVAGTFLRDSALGRSIGVRVRGSVRDAALGLFAPVFFVTAGFHVSIDATLANLDALALLVGVATVTKVLGTAAFYMLSGHGWREGVAVGAGMNGRGAVEIILAGLAHEAGLISADVFAVLVLMAIITTAMVPVTLTWSVRWLQRRGELVREQGQRAGTLIVGAGPLARTLAKVLSQHEPVRLIDSSPQRCDEARADGLDAVCGDALAEQTLAAAGADRAQRLLAVIGNPEVNALVAHAGRHVFHVPEVAMVRPNLPGGSGRASIGTTRAETVFGRSVDVEAWNAHIRTCGARIDVVRVTEDCPIEHTDRLGTSGLPLAVLGAAGGIRCASGGMQVTAGESLLVLAGPAGGTGPDRFDRLLGACPVLDYPRPVAAWEVFDDAASPLASVLETNRSELARSLLEREAMSSTVIAPGLAVPHVLVEGEGRFGMVIARCRGGATIPGHDAPAHAMFILVSSRDQRNEHLRALSAIAQIAQEPAFMDRWLGAAGTLELRRLLQSVPRWRWGDKPEAAA